MLRTNSKKARENVRRYIMESINFDELSYNILEQAAYDIKGKGYGASITYNEFEEWCRTFPKSSRGVNNILCDILEGNEAKREKYKENDAERELIRLIYRELCKGCDEYLFGYKVYEI